MTSQPKPVEVAQREILAAFSPLGREQVSLLDALGRFSAGPIAARCEAPAFDNSAMDGYALRSQDTSEASPERPLRLPVQGESRAGGPLPPALAPGSAMRIFTGALVPPGANAVQLQENVTRLEDHVILDRPLAAGAHIRRRGSDTQRGALLLRSGDLIGSGEVALLASQDVASVAVFRRPRVAMLSTGDELRDIGEPATPGRIVNSNAYALAAQVREAGAEPWILPPAPDRREDVAAALRVGLAADVLVVSGGVSVGDYDIVRDALAEAGIALTFWKVNMKPGKPLSFGRWGRVPVLGLPGNPVSAWVSFELFVRPGLRAMLGDPRPHRFRVPVQLRTPIQRKPGRTEFVRAQLQADHGQWIAEPLAHQGSGSLPSLVGVDALVVVPAERSDVAAGERLEALVLRLPG